jgi:type I restriction enzyme S subunit
MSAIKACIHDGFVYFPDLEIDPNFLYRIFEGRTCYGGLGKWGTQLNLNTDTIGSIRIALPPPRELNHVLAFLDRETAKIDALVAEQRRLIELLKEKRQAVISHAVTKGLNPDAPMKDSGIEWLGEVPAHWEVMRLKHVSPQITVGIVVEPSKYYVEDGVPALRSLNVEQGSVKLENLVFISKEANEAQAKSKLRQGDLVAVRTGQPGTTAVIPPDLDGCNCIDLIIIRKPANGNEWFLSWFLASDFALIQFSSGSGGAIQQHFNVGTAVNLIIPIPPRDEQNAIVDFINAETTKFDTLTSEAQRAIDLLQERRTALISAAVTGQIDVRHLSA